MVHDWNEDLFREKIFDYTLGDDAPLLIKKNTVLEFWVTWCPHCHAMMPRYEDVSGRFPDVDCFRVEMEQHRDLAALFEVENFPTFIFIRKDGVMKKWEGEMSESELSDLIIRAFSE